MSRQMFDGELREVETELSLEPSNNYADGWFKIQPGELASVYLHGKFEQTFFEPTPKTDNEGKQ